MNIHASPPVPENIPAEQALLGAILLNNDAYSVISGTGIAADHFSEDIHSRIYDAAAKLIDAGRHANPVTIKGYLPETMIGDMTTSQYVACLAAEAVTVANAPDFAHAVMISWARRDMLGISQNLTSAAMQAQEDFDLADTLQGLTARLEGCQRVIDGKAAEGVSFAHAASSALQSTMDAVSGNTVTGIDFGIPPLMQMIGPALPGKLIVIGGATKHGKSSLAQQIARGSADKGHPVYYYSGEMGADEISQREMARDSGISAKRQTEGRLTEHELEQLLIASRTVSKLSITVQDERRTLDRLIRDIKTFTIRAKRSAMPVVVVDSMLLLDRDRSQARMTDPEFAALVTDKLKATARDLHIPIFVLGQLKKNTIERAYRPSRVDASFFRNAISRRPRASDIYGSCEKDADHVVIVYNPEVVLRDMEPAEGTDEYTSWETVIEEFKDKAEILLSLSRSAKWPTRRTVQWDGVRHHFAYASDVQKGLF